VGSDWGDEQTNDWGGSETHDWGVAHPRGTQYGNETIGTNRPDWDVTYNLENMAHLQRAELTKTLLDAGVPHKWNGDELTVSRPDEAYVDSLVFPEPKTDNWAPMSSPSDNTDGIALVAVRPNYWAYLVSVVGGILGVNDSVFGQGPRVMAINRALEEYVVLEAKSFRRARRARQRLDDELRMQGLQRWCAAHGIPPEFVQDQ
jgi:hypothetical protein